MMLVKAVRILSKIMREVLNLVFMMQKIQIINMKKERKAIGRLDMAIN